MKKLIEMFDLYRFDYYIENDNYTIKVYNENSTGLFEAIGNIMKECHCVATGMNVFYSDIFNNRFRIEVTFRLQ